MSHSEEPSGDRRDFLYYATAGTGVVLTGAAVWPLVNSMNPSADTRAASTMRVDISGIDEGTQLTVLHLGKPVFIRRRTQVEIEDSEAVALEDLPDTDAQNPNLPDGAEATNLNRTLPSADGENTGEWLVMIGVCTHLGCVPLNEAGDYTVDGVGGWFCPCHGSHYDTAGRIRRGPAPENLWIPVARFVDESTILLG